eukprot:TRINITY_DN38612_c0_g1_i1.p1 TRINITY_DN38612_c0_g1~~TRINITY_DN38612_c0_g1_i1.p1  ORF type:complete len:195 (+),score=47.94 TRINITY_DN38612_c0_g1_i1:29-586(+)
MTDMFTASDAASFLPVFSAAFLRESQNLLSGDSGLSEFRDDQAKMKVGVGEMEQQLLKGFQQLWQERHCIAAILEAELMESSPSMLQQSSYTVIAKHLPSRLTKHDLEVQLKRAGIHGRDAFCYMNGSCVDGSGNAYAIIKFQSTKQYEAAMQDLIDAVELACKKAGEDAVLEPICISHLQSASC